MALLAFSCSKDSLTDDGSGQVLSGQKMLKTASGAVITLSPSQDGDDTDELLTAFEDAKAAGPGSTVQLAEGEYHIGFVLVEEFDGFFTGAGMGRTIIIPNMNLDNAPLYEQNLAPELLKFLRGDVKISGMSFLNLEGEPSTGDVLWAFLGLHDWAYNELPNPPEGHKITAAVDHVEFVSNPGPYSWSPYGVYQAIGVGPDFVFDFNLPYSNTDVSVTYCTFSNMGLAFGNLGVDKGRTVFRNNAPVETDAGVLLVDNIGGSTIISKNEFFTSGWTNAVAVVDASYNLNEFKLSDGCQYEISGNIFHATDAWGAITIADDRKGMGIVDNKNPVQVLIESNQFDLQGSTWTGIWNWITDDAVIRNNKFTGQAKTGIYVDERTTNSLMLGNSFSKLVCSELEGPEIWWLPDFGEGFKIILWGNNNTVVGDGNNNTTVLNLGENNKITGAKFTNEGEDPLGQTITDNYRIWKENMVKMRKR